MGAELGLAELEAELGGGYPRFRLPESEAGAPNLPTPRKHSTHTRVHQHTHLKFSAA